MIVGHVNSFCEAIVRLTVRGFVAGERKVEAVVDTGYNGYLTLPPELEILELRPAEKTPALRD